MVDDKFDIEKGLKKLENSPLFALSLGSKELFHSNFLYWLINAGVLGTKEDGKEITGRKLFCDIIKDLTGIFIDPEKDWVARREKMNFDLSLWETEIKHIKGKNKRVEERDSDCILVIENKLKSVPNKNQIEEYKDKLQKVQLEEPQFILLTLMVKFPDREDIEKEGCKIVSYREMIDHLIKEADTIIFVKDYYKDLIYDYCSFVNSLCILGEYTSLDKSLMLETDPNFNDLRILQLVQAIRVGELYTLLHKEFEKNKEYYKNIKFNTGYGQNGGAFLEILYAPFTGGISGRDERTGKEKAKQDKKGFEEPTHRSIGIQIQANRYSHFVCPLDFIKKGKVKLSENDKNEQDKNWVDKTFKGFFSHNNQTFPSLLNDEEQNENKENQGKEKELLKYHNNSSENKTLLSFESKKEGYHPRFAYQYAKIPQQANYKFIVDQVVKDINFIIEKYNGKNLKINKDEKS
ncbi:MAG: PD-(D/E)XK nuclease family protein [Muribaculaceae bacterium]|nr:PD-(D/E)XK nuclease family protein [Muribaculaceae bacterium]